MGDMADFTIDSGIMADLDEEEWDEDHDTRSSPFKVCKFCGRSGLTWGKVDGKWRLFEAGQIHRCPNKPLPAEKPKPKPINDYIDMTCHDLRNVVKELSGHLRENKRMDRSTEDWMIGILQDAIVTISRGPK